MYDIINNPIPHSGLFATRTLAEIQTEIESLPAKICSAVTIMFRSIVCCVSSYYTTKGWGCQPACACCVL